MRHLFVLATALGLGLSAPAHATVQTLTGTGFTVQYDDAVVGLFRTPTLVGNTLQWFPAGSPGFSAQSVAGIALTNSTFALQVTATPGYQLTGLSLFEAGDYYAYAGAGSTATVAVSGQLRATPDGGKTLGSFIVPDGAFSTSPVFDLQTTDWSATSALTLNGASLVNVSIQNLLGARVTGLEGLAFVEKKEVKLGVLTSIVPEQEPQVLLMAGLGVVGFLRWRAQSRDRL